MKSLEIKSQTQALTQALVLAITAPTDALSDECAQMAESFSVGLTDEQIEAAKAAAKQIAESM